MPRRAALTTKTPRTGRRTGNPDTREAILDAARHLFAERGYDGASIRAIGTAAGVDAALVVRFFGSKAKLLTASVRWPFDPDIEIERVLNAGRHHTGEALTRLFVTTWDELGERNPIITLLRSATTEPEAAAITREFMSKRLLAPLLTELGSDQPQLRADLVASQLIGLGLGRHVLHLHPLADTNAETIVAAVAPTIQRYLTGTLGPFGGSGVVAAGDP
jgi:AcrR family transcriptional regulator